MCHTCADLTKNWNFKHFISGTTLLLTVLDSGTLWAANVGDSRGILVSFP